jgi:hypothetical protein
MTWLVWRQIALRLVISDFLRQHYMAAVTTYYNVTGAFTPPGQAWVLAQGAVSQTGRWCRRDGVTCIPRSRPRAGSC